MKHKLSASQFHAFEWLQDKERFFYSFNNYLNRHTINWLFRMKFVEDIPGQTGWARLTKLGIKMVKSFKQIV